MASLFSVTIVGLDKVMGGLTAFQDVLKDLRPFWRDVFAPRFFAEVQDSFAIEGQSRTSGGRFGGGHWAALSPRYAVWKQKHFPGKTILERTGELRGSMVWNGSAPGPGGVFEAYPTFAIAGTTVPYGVFHMKGTPRMPARPFINSPDPAYYAPLLVSWLKREAKARGL